jgi:hypothetical protein
MELKLGKELCEYIMTLNDSESRGSMLVSETADSLSDGGRLMELRNVSKSKAL